jgi:dynein heavy chain
MELAGGGSSVKKVGAKFPHTPVVLKPTVGALDCEKIYELGVESAALGKVPNAPTLNAMDWPGGLRRRKHMPGKLPKISRVKLSKASSSATLATYKPGDMFETQRAASTTDLLAAENTLLPPDSAEPESPEFGEPFVAWGTQELPAGSAAALAKRRPYGDIVPHNQKVPMATDEGKSVTNAHLTGFATQYAVTGSRPGRTCNSVRYRPQAGSGHVAIANGEEESEGSAKKYTIPLEQFDQPELFEKYTEEEWLEACEVQSLETPGCANAEIRHWNSTQKKYVRVPCWILGYDAAKQRYLCEVISSGEKKLVKRLAVRFLLESEEKYEERLATCELKRKEAMLTKELTAVMEASPSDGIAPMSAEQKAKLIRLVLQNSRLETPENYVQTLRELMLSVEASYDMAMKFAILKERMLEHNGFPDATINAEAAGAFEPLLRVFLPKPAPYMGQVETGDWSATMKMQKLRKSMLFDSRVLTVGNAIYSKFVHTIANFRILDVERGRSMVMLSGSDVALSGDMIAQQLRAQKQKDAAGVKDEALPLHTWLEKLQAHRDQVVSLIASEWRTYIVAELSDTLADTFNFFVDSMDAYEGGYIAKLLTKTDLVLRLLLRQFIRDSLTDWSKFMQAFPHRQRRRLEAPPSPLLVIKVTSRNGKVVLEPSAAEVIQKIDDLVASVPAALLPVKSTKAEMVPCMDFEPESLYEMSHSDPALVSARKVTEAALTECLKRPDDLRRAYERFEYLLVEKIPDEFDPEDLVTAREKIGSLLQAADQVEVISASVEEMPLFEVHCSEIIEALTSTARGLAKEILKRLNTSAQERIKELNESWKVARQTVKAVPKNEEELASLKDYMGTINENVINPSTQTLKFGPSSIVEQINILSDFCHKELEEELIEKVYSTFHWSFTVKQDVGFRISEIELEKTKFMEALAVEKKKYLEDLTGFAERIEAVRKDFVDYDEANKYASEINGLEEDLQDGVRRVEDFNNRERLFNIELTERDGIEDLIDDYSIYHKLWTMAIDFKAMAEEWRNIRPLMSLNSDEVISQVDGWFKAAFNLRKQLDKLPIQLEVCNALLTAVKEFKSLYPIIESLCHPAIEYRHWYELFDAMDVSDPGEVQDILLSQLQSMGVANHIEKLEELAAGAQKEYSLRKALGSMREEWKTMNFETLPHKDSGTYLVKGIDEVQTLLDDHIVKTQAIRGSPFCKPFEKECREWEQKLSYIQEALDQVLNVQRTWLYLEPIFSSEDIARQMPGEAKKFQGVDALWRTTLAVLSENPGVLDFSDIENLLVNFTDANKKLDEITKSLNDYLETKRLYFPRFFFLSNDELLSILSETKDPTRVQPHMNKAFEGIAKVKFDKNDEIIEAMVSMEGEVVNLFNTVNVVAGDNKGNVEKWLLQVEYSMTHCLRIVTDNSMTAYSKNPRTKWVLEWPGMVVICVDMCYWTSMGEEYLTRSDITGYFDFQCEQLNDMIPLVRGELTKLERRTLAALTTIDVHNRDVIGVLAKDQVNDPNAFDWMAQLRYYWAQPGQIKMRMKGDAPNDSVECEVKIVNSKLLYAFEYLGNSDRLVITPLTDRCYRTLMGAFHLYYGGAPEGPAGTGKTETTKDFAKAVAVQCVVFNCSDGLDFIAMGKFFKGLASSGAWCCFDEFNRINVEVLSVVAQQVLAIQMAIREQKKKFIFEGTELRLIASCAVNITMNPGYAGRAELPDNLKALFRPCAMMVPDYALIGEIFLYSYGYKEAKDIGRKATLALRLSSEQLSAQDHYDFGMRGLKSILVASGALKRKYGDSLSEKSIALKGFLEVNEPKFTAQDIPLFAGIVGDLFPGIEKPPEDNQSFEAAIAEASVALGLQPEKYHILKTVQLWETILVRHGLMLVGLPPCGKSSVNFTLAKTLEALDDGEVMMPVTRYLINPKSIFQSQLYGSFDENTHEWSDGILAIAVRLAATAGLERRQWVQLDGPVDAIWIEDMNTVLDDNKKLCLLSGEIIKLSPVTNMIFEVADLAVASPATVSRVGVIFIEPVKMGWRPMIKSWIDTLPDRIKETQANQIYELFDAHFDAAVNVLRTLKMPIPCNILAVGVDVWLAKSLSRLMTPLLEQHVPDKKKDALPAKELENRVDILFFFSLLWSVGAATDASGRVQMDSMVRDMLSGMNASMFLDKWALNGICQWRVTPTKMKVPDPEKGQLYDFFVSPESGAWTPFQQLVKPADIENDAQFHTIIVPTVDMIRNQEVMRSVINGTSHMLFSGTTGTGKTVAAQAMLLRGFDKDFFTSMSFAFSAQTTHNQTQDIIDGKLDKRRKGVFGPPVGKKMLIFVDDLNMPQKDNYGAQGAIEILRQFMFQKGWYERKTAEFRSLIEISFVAAMGPPGGGKNDITARYAWHYNLLIFVPYVGDGLTRIFDTIMKWFLGRFASSITALSKQVVGSAIEVYEILAKELRPTPEKSHYTFNLRDISRVFQGICACNKDGSMEGPEDCMKVWAHEVERVFRDRLVNETDAGWFDEMLKGVLEKNYKKKYDTIVKVKPMIWGGFMDTKNTYKEIEDHDAVVEKFKEYLFDFNNMSKRQMDLVLFLAFAMHVGRVIRVLNLPLGNALCVGVGGSGRKSVSTLASFVVDYETFSIEISKSYGTSDWQDDMRRLLMTCGTKQQRTTFLFSDTQVQNETFLEDISNILNTGEIPNLFGMEEKMQIQDACTKAAQAAGATSSGEVFAWFVDKCRANLHIVLCLSPIGAAFRNRLRNYPSLVNCCTIDWFQEWPPEALDRVATQFLAKLEMEDDVKRGCVQTMVVMQRGVYQLTEKFRDVERRNYYVTPTSYLELISSFLDLIGKQRLQITTAKSRYDVGLKKIRETAQMISGMQIELNDLQPVLKKTSEENAALMVTIDKNQKEAAVTKANVQKDEAAANEVAAGANAMKQDCEKDLAEAMPALEAALGALKNLKKGDIVEVKSMAKPPAAVILTSHALCIMMGVAPNKVKAPDGKGKVDDWWDPAKKTLFGDSNLLDKLMNYDKDNMGDALITAIAPFEHNPDFMPEVVKKGSLAAAGICQWVRAMIIYDRVAKTVGPKKEQLAAAEAELAEAMATLKVKQDELKAVLDMLQKLEDDFKASKQKQDDLEFKSEQCRQRLERAEKLLANLGGEQDRWSIASDLLGVSYQNLTGDVVVASGIIAYLGTFTTAYRLEATEEWVAKLAEFSIDARTDYKLSEVIGDQVKIRQWLIDKLPNDAVSVDNAIVMDNSRRWPLMIDPQVQANKWIKNMYAAADTLKTLRLTKSDYGRQLEMAIQFGFPVLIENILETLDPMLEPLLQKAFYKAGNLMMIRLGDSTIEYSPNFKLYLTTKLANPHYAPEVCVTVTLLNFVTTQEGLADQLLAVLVAKEFPEMEVKRNQLVVESAESKAQLKEVEDKILKMLAESTGNILDDEELINTLANSKVTSARIEERVAAQERTGREIQETRRLLNPVADRSSSLFFVVSDLASIEPMYQYSLEWFINIYLAAIDQAEKARGETRNRNLNEKFIFLLYENVCRSLFEKDKLLLSILLTLKMLYFDNEADEALLNLFFTGGGGSGAHSKPKPGGADWLTDIMWGRILELDKLYADRPDGCFHEIGDKFAGSLAGWKHVFDADLPKNEKWPDDMQTLTKTIEKGLLLQAVRPDALVSVLQDIVSDKIGAPFLEPPPFNLDICFETSRPSIPLIFVLTMGADPGMVLLKFATSRNMKERMKLISLGQGQGPKANAEIEAATGNGAWVVLQNCHLATSYMPTLEAKVENFEGADIHEDFRLWLTAMPSESFPVMVLQNGIKMTVEPPKGLKANMNLAYLTLETEWLEECTKPDPFLKFVWGICFFHAVILDRRRFGPLGWNIPYQFADTDREISLRQTKMFMEEFDDIQYQALNYLIAECNYGGRVTDGQDRRTIKMLLSDYLCPDALDENYKYSVSGDFFPPPSTNKVGYLEYVKQIPLNPLPEVHWFHQNADLTAMINEGSGCMRSVVSLMPKGSGGGGSRSEKYKQLATEIIDVLPKDKYDIEAVQRKYPPDYYESMNVVLVQELIRFNKLYAKVSSTVKDLRLAVDGLVVFSAELEEVGEALTESKVPAVWKKVSFASLKPLGGYVSDFSRRLRMMDEWIERGPAIAFWISGFFFQAAFLTGIMQNMARVDKVAIDEVIWNYSVEKRETLAKVMESTYENGYTRPKIGCYVWGMFMEGARWDDDNGFIEESFPKVLYDPFPVVYMKPVEKSQDATGKDVYPCPIYKTSERRGVLSTTGHSTNFVITLPVPIQPQHSEKFWTRRGVAMLTQLDD